MAIRSTREIVVWSEAVEILNRKIDAAIAAAAEAADLRSMGFAQGQLSAFREMLTLPKAMCASVEMQEAEEKALEAIRRSQDSRTWKHPDLGR